MNKEYLIQKKASLDKKLERGFSSVRFKLAMIGGPVGTVTLIACRNGLKFNINGGVIILSYFLIPMIIATPEIISSYKCGMIQEKLNENSGISKVLN
jgi:hypothetical protein